MLTSPSVSLFLSLIHAGRQLLCDVQLTPVPLPIYHGCGGQTRGRGEERTRQLGKHETKRPSRRRTWIGMHVFVCLCDCVNTIETTLKPEEKCR